MKEAKFRNVGLDNYTYSLLDGMSKDDRLTKAALLRRLIRDEAARRGNGHDINAGLENPTLVQAVTRNTGSFRMGKRNKEGVIETPLLRDLNLIQRLVSYYGLKTNKPVDKAKLKDAMRDALTLLADDLEEALQS